MLTFLSKQALNFIIGRNDAMKIYDNLLPAVMHVCSTKGRSTPEAIGILNVLGGLPTFGARRTNFKTKYIDDPMGWRDLPPRAKDLNPFYF